MASRKTHNRAALGFRAKTGRAITVALLEPADAPVLLWRREISLADPRVPETSQPYQEVMELPWSESQRMVQALVRAIEEVATSTLASLLAELRSNGVDVFAVGVVGPGDRNLEKIGNPHIRAHAAEGVLFRRVLEVAATRKKLPHRALTEGALADIATAGLDPRGGPFAEGLKSR